MMLNEAVLCAKKRLDLEVKGEVQRANKVNQTAIKKLNFADLLPLFIAWLRIPKHGCIIIFLLLFYLRAH